MHEKGAHLAKGTQSDVLETKSGTEKPSRGLLDTSAVEVEGGGIHARFEAKRRMSDLRPRKIAEKGTGCFQSLVWPF
ncbi:unnamed protein product [Nippostrongylus brasiliensis]|uniref:Uncharacterized protein n=1 Tax=Nippostrongylus brasiliensis TaxID=27835 RepID=A0A0N4Y5H7_NIPBR|nr:unnamed protein product [Nippostrongylus brasiliensis]